MNITLRILCVEDSCEDFELISNVLQKGELTVAAKRVETQQEFNDALVYFKPHVILSDHSLPAFDSSQALSIAKFKCPDVPFILVTGAVSNEFAMEALKLGVDDYVLKSNLGKLPAVIQSAWKHREAARAKERASVELAKRNKELAKMNRDLDSFVYSASHNLRAPLMSLLGLVDLASQEKNIQKMNEYHLMMRKSILKLDSTLKDILQYTKNARQEDRTEAIDFSEMIENLFEKVRYMPGCADIQKIVNVYSPNEFRSDAYRLSVVFENLISNAIKYYDPTKHQSFIEIKVNVCDENAVIEFRDNGIGIERALQPQVFEMFFRATESSEGAGLGLYIVKEAIDILDGKISIESELGHGTTFRIEVPNKAKKLLNETLSTMLLDRD